MAKKSKKNTRTQARSKKTKKVSSQKRSFSKQSILQQAQILHRAGHLSEAEVLYKKILAVNPNDPESLYFLGILANQVGKNEIAVELIRKALTVNPNYALAHYNLGNLLREQGKLEEATNSYRQALKIKPDYIEVYNNLGNVLREQGNLDEAIVCFSQALIVKPDDAMIQNNLGNTLKVKGKLKEAITSYRQAITVNPNYALAHYNLGNVLREQGELDEATNSYRQALKIKPDYIEAYNNLGNTLMDLGNLSKAVASFNQALKKKPDYADAHYNLGNALMDLGKLNEAAACYRQVLKFKPNNIQAHSNLLFCLNYMSDISQKDIYIESLHWNTRYERFNQEDTLIFENSLREDRRLKIGYVSPDFRKHSVAFFIEPILKTHNRKKAEIFCYANVEKPDPTTQRLRTMADHWFSTVGMEYDTIAARINNDKIDILVDLAGHTNKNILPVFARKPAPIQVNWLGYPNTTGLKAMDYRFTDLVADPESKSDKLHSEKLIRLKHGFLCYQPESVTPKVGPLPSDKQSYITFGSFNNLTKVTHEVVKAWAKVLHSVPNSRLLLKSKQFMDDEVRASFLKLFAHEGIRGKRIEMFPRVPNPADHLGLYSRVDIGLDPFPYNGTTTTCEALWMGVPVVTLLGTRHAGRVGASILHRVGLDELIAPSIVDYIELARMLTLDRKRLKKIRFSLRDRMQKSELMNRELFTSHLEDVYQQIWLQYCEIVQSRLTGN